MKINLGASGKVKKLNVLKSTGEIKQEFSFKNDFLNSYFEHFVEELTSLGNDGDILLTYILHFGTGTTENSPNHSGLISPNESGETITAFERNYAPVITDIVNNTNTFKATLRFRSTTPGYLQGTWTEIGLGDSTDTMMTRALIVDENGDPSSITVLSDEYIYVEYEYEIVLSAPSLVGEITIGGEAYSYKSYINYRNPNLGFGSGLRQALPMPGSIVYNTGDTTRTISELEADIAENNLSEDLHEPNVFAGTLSTSKINNFSYGLSSTVTPPENDYSFKEISFPLENRSGYATSLQRRYGANSPFLILFDRPVIHKIGDELNINLTLQINQ